MVSGTPGTWPGRMVTEDCGNVTPGVVSMRQGHPEVCGYVTTGFSVLSGVRDYGRVTRCSPSGSGGHSEDCGGVTTGKSSG